MPTVDLSADLGEDDAGGGGAGQGAREGALLDLVTTVHIACGFHAGDASTMRRTAAAAVAAGVTVGAHPSYPDRDGFGRRAMDISAWRVADDLLYQVAALDGLAQREGGTVRSVKPHGALYHRVAVDAECARAVAEALGAYRPGLRLVVPSGSPILPVLDGTGVVTLQEAFCDRAYRPDGGLVDREEPGAVISDPGRAASQARLLVMGRRVRAVDGTEIPLAAQTLCVHGDTPGALAVAGSVRAALDAAGVRVASPPAGG